MSVYIIRRLLQAVVVIAAMSILVFAGVFMIGDPSEILISDDADQAERERLIESLGLNLPWYMQYLRFVVRALHGDLGKSFVFNEPALRLILDRMPATSMSRSASALAKISRRRAAAIPSSSVSRATGALLTAGLGFGPLGFLTVEDGLGGAGMALGSIFRTVPIGRGGGASSGNCGGSGVGVRLRNMLSIGSPQSADVPVA